MDTDRYMKIIITIIAIGILGINYNLFQKSFVKNANAKNNLDWKVISDDKHIFILANNGQDICNAYTNTSNMITGKWVKTHC